jgi:hypothetical protein
MDPNVQVALVSVLATFITTLGVISVAVINNRKERAKAADAGVEAGLDERDVLERMLSLISENERKESALSQARAENEALKEEVRRLKAENTMLRLGKDADFDTGGGDDV